VLLVRRSHATGGGAATAAGRGSNAATSNPSTTTREMRMGVRLDDLDRFVI
jgi:hypothetical protein